MSQVPTFPSLVFLLLTGLLSIGCAEQHPAAEEASPSAEPSATTATKDEIVSEDFESGVIDDQAEASEEESASTEDEGH